MTKPTNPFQILYVTEYIKPAEFPKLFSPVLVPHVQPLFQPGNVVLHGTQGTGKSMLLSLLDSTVRLQFAEQDIPSPIPERHRNFVAASINLSSSNATKFNERRFSEDAETDLGASRASFSDFLNYWVVRDLFQSVERIAMSGGSTPQSLGVDVTNSGAQDIDAAAEQLARDQCWFSAMDDVATYKQLKEALAKRLREYFAFLNFNTDQLPLHVERTKSSAGEPIQAAVKALQATNVIGSDTRVFVVVDQFEELQRLEANDSDPRRYSRFRDVVDKLLSARDMTVSYRLGTRTSDLVNWRPEQLRDYLRIDLDSELVPTENTRSSLFRSFAEDVLRRRVAWAGYDVPDAKYSLLKGIFGESPAPSQRAKRSAPENPAKVIKLESSWPQNIGETLRELAKTDVLSAKLGEAWVRQRMARTRSEHKSSELPSSLEERPWEQKAAKWWKKERTPQAILQIASINKQRVVSYGEDDIIAFSGGNILVFGSICQHVWDAWLRHTRNPPGDSGTSAPIDIPWPQQDEGIRRASAIWRSKIVETPGGNARQRFIDHLGKLFHQKLTLDVQMSYPGANGFSLPSRSLLADRVVAMHLFDAVSFGFLQQRPHTPKTLSRGKSLKWYLHPILSPYYEIPFSHTKEPLYVSIDEVWNWLVDAQVILEAKRPLKRQKRAGPEVPSLFDLLEDGSEGGNGV